MDAELENMGRTKKCNKCGKVLPVSSFSYQAKALDKLNWTCRDCCREYKKKYYAEHPDKLKEQYTKRVKYQREYYHSHREEHIAYSMKYHHKHLSDVRHTRREWGKKNHDKELMWHRAWKVNHPEKETEYSHNRRSKVINASGKFTAKEWKELKNDYGNRCVYCGKITKPHADHVIPLVRGGSNSIDNIAPACMSCNSTKSGKSLLMFLYSQRER